MVMEVCNNNLIIAIYSCKVGTCKKKKMEKQMTIQITKMIAMQQLMYQKTNLIDLIT
jgi:hypothetical protein